MSSNRSWNVELWAADKKDGVTGKVIEKGARLEKYEEISDKEPSREKILFDNHEKIVAAGLTAEEVVTRVVDPFRGQA
jgi:hypothetical protein